MAKKIIMSWAECRVEVGYTGEDDAMATELVSVGTINDQSTTLASSDGQVLEAKASGGVTVATEESEPVLTITTRVKEMDFDTENYFTGAKKSTDGNELEVFTNVVNREFSVKVTPKNIGATGIKVPRCSVKFRPGSSEAEGQYVDLTFTILKPASGALYKKFKVQKADWGTLKYANANATAEKAS